VKIVTVVGARPQFIKAVVVSRQIRKNHKELIIHTGQHYDYELSDIFFKELNIPFPDYNLEVGSGSHAEQTSKAMTGIEAILIKEKPDIVLVYGDTNSTLAGALAAVKIHIPIAHVEAGIRMFDKTIPEEINRVLTDHVSSLLFAPTKTAVRNLKRESITEGVYFTGDVMLDSFLYFSQIAMGKSKIIEKLGLINGDYILATVHRVKNTDIRENLNKICEAFVTLDEKIVFPIHPRTKKYLKQYGLFDLLKNSRNVIIIEPVGYLDSIMLTQNAKKIITDSGGLQKEAYFAKVPCITLYENTGWPETVKDGWNTIVDLSKDDIIEAINNFVPIRRQRNEFGNGRASEKIAEIISDFKKDAAK
jgi:UDP-N-acetylglucosamine 2-epimerase